MVIQVLTSVPHKKNILIANNTLDLIIKRNHKIKRRCYMLRQNTVRMDHEKKINIENLPLTIYEAVTNENKSVSFKVCYALVN